ncbi:DUF6895 family protein [Kitasatospora purpeofusca]|uniref:DUF6895 family protein n=1 Tax=Kitasatospora purpeofusca TaxID=67352 RepID=UPI002A5ACF55|nr:hypothetical protein [Kitasatospora purpeofusca]MDY0816300.1 hypothetical protein [Kitasatospora purpeofusca]
MTTTPGLHTGPAPGAGPATGADSGPGAAPGIGTGSGPRDAADGPPGHALERLGAGTLGWIGRHLDHFDPFTPAHSATHGATPAPGGAHRPAKAALELALLTHCWTRLDPGDDPRRAEATVRVRAIWQHPGFPRLLTAEPRGATQYRLACAALAPAGTADAPFRAAVARLTAADLAPAGRSPYQRLEVRYYADKAGVPHAIESYPELARRNVLVALPATALARARRRSTLDSPDTQDTQDAQDTQGAQNAQDTRNAQDAAAPRPDEPPVTVPEAYALTHSAFYLSDFARTGPGLPEGAVADAAALTGRLLDHCVRHDWWDLAAELVMTQVCLGLEPTGTPEGAAAIACLARAQRPDGSIPGRSAATRAGTADPAAEYFAKAYHTTLVTALMTLLLGPGRTP